MGILSDWRSRGAITLAVCFVAAVIGGAFVVHSGHRSRVVTVRLAQTHVSSRVRRISARRTLCHGTLVIPFGPHSMFAPFTRKQVVAVANRWRWTTPVEVRSGGLAYSTRYQKWRIRARMYVLAFVQSGRLETARAARHWIADYEHAERKGMLRSVEMPVEMANALGQPPHAFRGPCNQYRVHLPWVRQAVVLRDNPVDADYPFLVNPTGVADEGTPIDTRPEASRLMRAAGLNHQQRLVLLKVSSREGGFEAVNTYDTGYVSVGFIQFAAMATGQGSLAKLLERTRATSPKEYHHFFQSYGVDVDEQHALCVIDPDSGEVLHGEDAVDAIIDDKRLTAVFWHAGASSHAFQEAQIAQAAEQYYAPRHRFSVPVAEVVDHGDTARSTVSYYYGDDAIAMARATVDAQNLQAGLGIRQATYSGPRFTIANLPPLSGEYGQVFRSDAGRTAITDRCIQRGFEIGPKKEGLAAKFAVAVDAVAGGRRVSVTELANRERDLIPVVQNRVLVLADRSLSQPQTRVAAHSRMRPPKADAV